MHYRYAFDMKNPFALADVRIGPSLFDGSHGLPIGDFFVLSDPDFLAVEDSVHTITSFHYVGYGDYLYRDLGITAKKITSSGIEMVFYGSGKGYRPLNLSGLEEGLYLQTYLASIAKNYSKGAISAIGINYIEKPGYVVAYNQLGTPDLDDDLYFMKAIDSYMLGLEWEHYFAKNIMAYFRNSYHSTSKDSYIGELGEIEEDPVDRYDSYQTKVTDTGLEYMFNRSLDFYFKSFLEVYNYGNEISNLPEYNFSVKKNQLGVRYKFGHFHINTSIDYLGYRYNESWSGPSNMLKRGGYKIKYENIYLNNLKVSIVADRENFGTLAYGSYKIPGTTEENSHSAYEAIQNINVINHYIDNFQFSLEKYFTKIDFGFGRIEWEDRRYDSIGYFDIPFYLFSLNHKKENFKAKIFYKKFSSPEYSTHPAVSEANFSTLYPLIDSYYSYNFYYSFKFKERYRFKNFVNISGRYSKFSGSYSFDRYSDIPIASGCDGECFDDYIHIINLVAGFDFGDFVLTFNWITNDGDEFAAFNSNEEIFPVPERDFLGNDLNVFFYARVDWKFKD